MFWSILKNRYTITLGLIALLTGFWNLYVVLNDDGILEGHVVDLKNRPVKGAAVVLSEKSLLVTAPRDEVRTDAAGFFRFEGHKLYHLYLEVRKEGFKRGKTTEFRLYFKGQNKKLKKPLVLEAAE